MILDKLDAVQARVAAAARRAGRDPSGVELVAVAKKAPIEALSELLKSGRVRHIGENRVQDALARRKVLDAQVAGGSPLDPSSRAIGKRGQAGSGFAATWRMIGHLQTNKAGQTLRMFGAVDSVDSLHLAEALNDRLAQEGRVLPVLAQIKLSGSPSQYGVSPEDAPEFAAALRRFPRLETQGLMAIAPMIEPVEAVRPYFRALKELFDRLFPEASSSGGPRRFLSMGMSRDFEIAVEEGATMVRVGSALFSIYDGPRPETAPEGGR